MGKNINGDRPTAFPLEQEKLPFTIPVVEEPRPKIAKLVAMITDRVPAKLKGVKGNDPEYWGLADLVTDEMADVALKMGVRKPKTIGQLMKLTKLEREPLQKLLDDMAWAITAGPGICAGRRRSSRSSTAGRFPGRMRS